MSEHTTAAGTRSELAEMELWTAWVAKLMDQAATKASDARTYRTLRGAAEDAQALREALGAAGTGWLDPGQTTVLRSIFDLWAANQDRLEQLAAAVDPEWHRMWSGRSASARVRGAGEAQPSRELVSR